MTPEQITRLVEAQRHADLLRRVLRDCLLTCDFGRHADELRWHLGAAEDAHADLSRLSGREVWQ